MSMNQLIPGTIEETNSQMIVFASAKGGVGKTILSVNTAVSLANKGFSTCVLDGSFQFGDINLALDIQPRLTISDLVQDLQSLDSGMMKNYLHSHEIGVKILSAPLKPEYADLITPQAVSHICEKILQENEFLIVDMAAGLSEHNINFMELASTILIVTDLEMAALKNTKTMLKTLKALDMEQKIKVIVNRGDMESVIKFRDVRGILETDNLIFISNNFKVVSKSFNVGIPFVINKPKERISNEISDLADQFYENRYFAKRRRAKKQSLLDIFKR